MMMKLAMTMKNTRPSEIQRGQASDEDVPSAKIFILLTQTNRNTIERSRTKKKVWYYKETYDSPGVNFTKITILDYLIIERKS